ncbi:unnamed protein product [Closterium sp. Naga37s-1]|nr:unnamed protein product [Closterium sp. Naga37s-1]
MGLEQKIRCLVMEQQQRGQGLPVRFAGIVIGNGFTDPRIQVQVHEHVARAFSMLTGQQADYVKEEANRVVHLIDREEWEEAHYARTALCEWIEHKAGIPTLLDIRRHAKYHASQGGVDSEAWMRTLSWKGTDSFWNAERMVWLVSGKREGYWRQWKNLTHVIVTGAGHQVPADQPEAAAAMIETWVEQHISLERPTSQVQTGEPLAVETWGIDEPDVQPELTLEAAMASLNHSAGNQALTRTRL